MAKTVTRLQPENYGYPITLRCTATTARIVSGCRDFTFAEAVEHWEPRSVARCWCGHSCDDTQVPEPARYTQKTARKRARAMLALLPVLEERAKKIQSEIKAAAKKAGK